MMVLYGRSSGATATQNARMVMTRTKVAILPLPAEKGACSYRAIAGDKHGQGNTAGEALDALTAQLYGDEAGTMILVQSLRPDRYFTAVQQQRLEELMARWRAARDQGSGLSVVEQTELQELVDAELRAATSRASEMADTLGR